MKNTTLFVTLLLILSISFINSQESSKYFLIRSEQPKNFQEFKKQFKKNYSKNQEDAKRKINFQKNLQKLKKNPCPACGVTSLFDLSQAQIAKLKGLKIENNPNYPSIVNVTETVLKQQKNVKRNLQTSTSTSGSSISVGATPTTLDWRTGSKVTPVKNQGSCGSCWAFSTAAFFESELLIKGRVATSNPPDLAQQFLLKCDGRSNGCNGGSCYSASNVVLSKGMPLESKFPYNPYKSYSKICTSTPAYKFNGSIKYFASSLEKMNGSIIQQWLQVRPVMIYVTAANWQLYKPSTTGQTFSCSAADSSSPNTIDHAVLLVGYTQTEWIIKNSWGTAWGKSGYIYLSRDPAKDCGVGWYVFSLV